ncbi:hypothetical protein D9756_007319 [Leucocoprinus leucothites]|uniref:pyranose dehydrogenase (acceptor) n=1 Tax=Leucocoprinus leucothites TaxID=201217 RepID=A0A8H5FY79_9AGAR|nr:hypothetical protein D9756_007319 [Leucoagaricus leucothites]
MYKTGSEGLNRPSLPTSIQAMLLAAYSVLTLLTLIRAVLSAQYFQRSVDLPQVAYDFIVIGGGTAGGVVGSRLGEIRDHRVLVIEAGPSNQDVFDSQVPGLSHNIGYRTQFDWNFTTTPQNHVNNTILSYPRAMILGGCSSHNEMTYTRGSQDDYDRWAATTGDDNLSWKNILPYIQKVEKWSTPNDPNLPEDDHFNSSVHNKDGMIGVTAPYFPHPFNDLLLNATREMNDEFPFLLDLNSGKPIGLGWGQASIAHGLRSSSATAYLAHANDNVHILLNTHVTRILPSTNQSHDFRTVEFTSGPEATARHTLTAEKEIILSGGAIGSPQLLLLSGIGPREELEELGIEVIIDNPSVGRNFSDQVSVPVSFSTTLPPTDFDQMEALSQWKLDGTGRLALARHLSPIGWVRLAATSEPFKDGSPDPTGGQNSPHLEFFFGGISSLNDSTGIGNPPPATKITAVEQAGVISTTRTENNLSLQIDVVDVNPVSRGSIKLSGPSLFDPPLIDPALLASSLDTAILTEGIRSLQRLWSSSAFSEHISGFSTPAPLSTQTEDIVEYIKHASTPFGHGVGSCSMAPRGAEWGVVDPEFKVRGLKGLRIVDASVIPFIPSGHTQAPVYAIAEWASNVIRSTYEGL